MKKRAFFKSIYAKFTLIFLGIWWLLNSMTFGIIINVMSNSDLSKIAIDQYMPFTEFHRIKTIIGFTFFASAIVGTIIILLVVRSVVKPIKRLSKASKEVAKGNFDIEVDVKSKDEIGQLTADFNLMTKELKNIETLRKDFISNVSHEFKTPITSIKGFAKLIRDGKLSSEQLYEYSDLIYTEGERLSLLSSNMLRLSELENKAIQEPPKIFSLDEQIRKTILLLEAQWLKKEIEFDIELDEVSIIGDAHLLQEVWLNLIQNAIKFSNQGGTIKVLLCKNAGKVKVEICDNGIGITEEDKKHIFERFFKSDKSRSKDGNGLGLVIVKNIVELFKGKVYFKSELGKGTTFFVELNI
jgi:signal transduction histidine kinase